MRWMIHGEREASWPFDLEIRVAEPLPRFGALQRDYTVMYRVDATPTPSPSAIVEPSSSDRALQSDSADVKVLLGAIPLVAEAWNSALGLQWPYLRFCEQAPTPDSASFATCDAKNTDGQAVAIAISDGLSGSGAGPCGPTYACVHYDWMTGAYDMVIESPASTVVDERTTLQQRSWSARLADHNYPRMLPSGKVTVGAYALGAVAHEFGHTVGLFDLYFEEHEDRADGFLMQHNLHVPPIPSKDLQYTRQLYQDDHVSGPDRY